MNEPNPKKRPNDNKESGSKDPEASKAELIREAKKEVKKTTKTVLGELRAALRGPTLKARSYDKTSVRHGQNLAKVERILRRDEKPFLLQLDDLLMSNVPYAVVLAKIKKITRNSERSATGYKDAIEHAIKALASTKYQLKPGDYALISSVIDRVTELYSKNHDIGNMMLHIRQGVISKGEWDLICSKINQYPHAQDVNKDMDNIDLSITALLFKVMDQNQRFQAVLEFGKRYSNDEAMRLAESLTNANVLNIRQYEVLMQKLSKDKDYRISDKKEKQFQNSQAMHRKLLKNIDGKLQTALHINGAERIFNRKAIGGMLITGIGILGMITNYVTSMNAGKGAGKFVAGFKNPYFILSAGIAAGGTHISQKAGYAGEHGTGLFDRVFVPRSPRNPFGVSKEAVKQNKYFDELTTICKDHRILENWLLHNQGFDDMSLFLAEKHFDKQKMDVSVLEKMNKPKKDGGSLVEQFKKFQISRGNRAGAMKIEAAENAYGKAKTQRLLTRLFMVSSACEIQTSKKFKTRKVPGQLFTYKALLRDKQGLKAIPNKQRPEVHAKAQAAAAKAKKKAQAAADALTGGTGAKLT